MYDALNPRWASTLLGLIAVVMIPIPLVLMRFGPTLRRKSKHAPTLPHELVDAKKEKNNGNAKVEVSEV